MPSARTLNTHEVNYRSSPTKLAYRTLSNNDRCNYSNSIDRRENASIVHPYTTAFESSLEKMGRKKNIEPDGKENRCGLLLQERFARVNAGVGGSSSLKSDL